MKNWRKLLPVIAVVSLLLASCAADTAPTPSNKTPVIPSEELQEQQAAVQEMTTLQTESAPEEETQEESLPETETEEIPEAEAETEPSEEPELTPEEEEPDFEPEEPETGKPSEQEPEPLEEGKLEITSAFPFTGINPDRNWEECENAASIRVRNVSEEYLLEADIQVTYTDGTHVSFRVAELPAGKSALAFCLNGETIDVDAAIEEIHSDAQFMQTPEWEAVSATTEGTAITVSNHTEDPLENIKVYCRNAYGEDSLGGIAYCYEIDTLPANDTFTIKAADCFLGEAEVVRVEYNH